MENMVGRSVPEFQSLNKMSWRQVMEILDKRTLSMNSRKSPKTEGYTVLSMYTVHRD